jgi:lipopolysaccharide transport system permease protein
MQMESVVIRPSSGWKFVDLKEVWRYKDLLYFLTIRGIKAKYAQSVLGVSWAIVQPLVTAIIFTIIFSKIARIGSGGVPYPLFCYLALWPWHYFAGTVTESSNSLIANSSMLTKVYFPRLVLPMSAALFKLLDFAIAFVVVVVLMFYYGIAPGIQLLYIPLFMIQLLMTSLGLGLILSAMAVQYRDIKHALTFFIQVAMYAAPVVYSTDAIPERFQFLYAMNPMVGVIEGFRATFLNQALPWDWILPGYIVSVSMFFFGLVYFRRMERVFADVA